MSSLHKQYSDWRRARRRKFVNWWTRKRAGGRARFVLNFILLYLGLILLTVAAFDLYYDGRISMSKLLSNGAYYLVTGFIIAVVAWWDNERRYRIFAESDVGVNAERPAHHIGET